MRGRSCASSLTAAYLLLAYVAALPLSDLLAVTLFVCTGGRVLAVRAGAPLASAVACGLAAGALAITRPAFIPFVLVAAALTLPRVRHAATIVVLAAIVLAPWFAYSQTHFGRPLVGNSGAVLWIGYFQGKVGGSAGDPDAFRALALAAADRAPLVAAGARMGLDEIETVEAAAAVREIRTFELLDDRLAQSRAYGTLNDSLTARALRLIAHDTLGWIARGLSSRTLELFAHDEPYRVIAAPTVPFAARLAAVIAQLLLLALAEVLLECTATKSTRQV